uniref:Uncharacterized protein n=1 Tax=Amphimedon queenslandica TaxID=400682 RepID=A0A1X7UPE2_AMPQE
MSSLFISYLTVGASAHIFLEVHARGWDCRLWVLNWSPIITFGSRMECRTECNVVKLGLELKNYANLEHKLFTVSHIWNNLIWNFYNNNLEFSISLDHCKQIKPGILIGSDQYWSLLTG